jgi:ketopantoate reductase
MKIAVMGVGALGVVIGGLIANNNHDVVLIAASERTVTAIKSAVTECLVIWD